MWERREGEEGKDREDLRWLTERKIPCSTQVVRIPRQGSILAPLDEGSPSCPGKQRKTARKLGRVATLLSHPSTPPLKGGGSSTHIGQGQGQGHTPTRTRTTPRAVDRSITSRSTGDPYATTECGSIHSAVNNPKCRPHGPIKTKDTSSEHRRSVTAHADGYTR